jgi:hypothetical protein
VKKRRKLKKKKDFVTLPVEHFVILFSLCKEYAIYTVTYMKRKNSPRRDFKEISSYFLCKVDKVGKLDKDFGEDLKVMKLMFNGY